jgi:MoxR-like ATPase
MSEPVRPHAEQRDAGELAALAAHDDRPRPPNWRLSPWAVVDYVLGTELADGTVITPKYIGNRRLIEVAVATLATDRTLLLLGLPGTAKTWVSEHLAAAISADSTLLVQGTAGTPEEAIRYGWNYARLLTEGPSEAALVASPVLRAMRAGAIVRVEELTRIPSDVQDALITVLSEKALPIPELGTEVAAERGFNLVATANDRDRGVNDLSSALRRRFNTVILPLPPTAEEEVAIVTQRVADLGASLELPEVTLAADDSPGGRGVRELRWADRGRAHHLEDAVGHPFDCGGDLGRYRRARPRRPLRQRSRRARRYRRENGGRHRARPCARSRRVA